MKTLLGFDVYGTLIDTLGITRQLEPMLGGDAAAFATRWREKQLEYTFRRGLMRAYRNFNDCTCDSLNYCCTAANVNLSDSQKQSLLDAYLTLPAFADVEPGLQSLQAAGVKLFAFSNGVTTALESLLTHAGIQGYFADIVSVDEIQTFKPNPDVYAHFLTRTGATAEQAWLVSSNGFDIIGAVNAGLNAAWIKRSDKLALDPWGIEPTLTVTGLDELGRHFALGGIQ